MVYALLSAIGLGIVAFTWLKFWEGVQIQERDYARVRARALVENSARTLKREKEERI